jgi:pimeloyl-ACP methyl ester carboxylesterase
MSRRTTLSYQGCASGPSYHDQDAGARRMIVPGVAHLPSLEKPHEFMHVVSLFLKGLGEQASLR